MHKKTTSKTNFACSSPLVAYFLYSQNKNKKATALSERI